MAESQHADQRPRMSLHPHVTRVPRPISSGTHVSGPVQLANHEDAHLWKTGAASSVTTNPVRRRTGMDMPSPAPRAAVHYRKAQRQTQTLLGQSICSSKWQLSKHAVCNPEGIAASTHTNMLLARATRISRHATLYIAYIAPRDMHPIFERQLLETVQQLVHPCVPEPDLPVCTIIAKGAAMVKAIVFIPSTA